MAKKKIVRSAKKVSLVESLKKTMTYKLDEETKQLLFANSEIKEEDSSRLQTLFESAVNAKVKETTKAVSGVYKKAFGKQLAEARGRLTKKISAYLEDIVEEWYDKNQVKLKRSFVDKRNAQIVESIQRAYGANFVKLPERNGDILRAVVHKATAQKKRLVESNDRANRLQNKINGMKCERSFARASFGLADTEVEKLLKLVEHIDISNPKKFGVKVREIRESVFPSKVQTKAKVGKKVMTESKLFAVPTRKTKSLTESKGTPETSQKLEAIDPIKAASRVLGRK